MNSTDTYEQDGPPIEADLLLRFATKRLDELLQTDCSKMSVILKALLLTCVAHDPEANMELRELFFPTTLVKRCRDILGRVSVRSNSEQPLELFRDGPFRRLSERESRQILLSAMREVRKITADQDFEFAPMIRVLGWIALQPYPRRLQEFETVWEAETEPAELMEEARKVLWSAFRHKDAEPL